MLPISITGEELSDRLGSMKLKDKSKAGESTSNDRNSDSSKSTRSGERKADRLVTVDYSISGYLIYIE